MSLALIAQSYLVSGDEEGGNCDNFEEGTCATAQDGLYVDLKEIRELVRQLQGLEVGKSHTISHRHPSISSAKKQFQGPPPRPDKPMAEYRCPYCYTTFELAQSLIQHLRSCSSHNCIFPKGNGRGQTNPTGKRLDKPSFIEIRQGSGRKMVKCSSCEKAFWKKWRAARHLRSHFRTGSCLCIICLSSC